MKPNKLPEDAVKALAGGALFFGILLGAVLTFSAIVDWPLERKFLLVILFVAALGGLNLLTWTQKKRRGAGKKLPWLWNLFVEIQNELNPEHKKLLRGELRYQIFNVALVSVISTIFLATGIDFGEKGLGQLLHPPTSTSTPTQTLTATIPPTLTWTPSPPPASRSHYYMIVLDATINMQESFDGQSKWGAELITLSTVLDGLNHNSNYGLVVIGGSTANSGTDPCSEPSKPVIPLVSDTQVLVPSESLRINSAIAQINQLQPMGGGSLSTAFNLAKNQLEDLPTNTVTSLIFITGAKDTCDGRDEWQELEAAVELLVNEQLFSRIIVLDEKSGFITQKIADRINAISAGVNVQVSQDNHQLQQAAGNVVNQVNTYVELKQAALENPALGSIVSNPSSTSASQNVATVQLPTFTTIPPVSIPPTSVPPTAIPPTTIPPTSPPVPPIQWALTSSDGRYGVQITSGSGLHCQVFETSTNSPIFTTSAKYSDANDVKACEFSANTSKFAAVYHYGDNGDYTWIGVWDTATGQFLYAWEKPGWTADFSGVFDGPP